MYRGTRDTTERGRWRGKGKGKADGKLLRSFDNEWDTPVGSASEIRRTAADEINPDDMIAWLMAQPSARGVLYVEREARQYIDVLRSAPVKLDIPVAMRGINVFACRTLAEFDSCWEIFRTAADYHHVNNTMSGMLSSALFYYMRYLQSLADGFHADEPELVVVEVVDDPLDAPDSPSVGPGRPASAIRVRSMRGAALNKQLTGVLSARFQNGFRLNSSIELARFRSFSAEDLDGELAFSDEDLRARIAACGMDFEGKIFIIPNSAKKKIRALIEKCLLHGTRVVYFTEFYRKNEQWLLEANIVSSDMLAVVLRDLFPELSHKKDCFGHVNSSIAGILESEILRIWGEDILLDYGQLAERLPYIPVERIKQTLGHNGDFIRNSKETFSHICRIEITKGEGETIRAAAARTCAARGYASIADLLPEEIAERNYELSAAAVHSAAYRICLADGFDMRGSIVTRKGEVFNTLTLMKEYCLSIDACSLDELSRYQEELTGESQPGISLEAGNAVMVRVDKDNFVSDAGVDFNVSLIDVALGRVVEDDYLPLKSFITFAAFPDCGKAWNLFLLESYCRRFSLEFRFESLTTNSRNAGVVVRKGCGLDYVEIMTDAVARSFLPLTEEAVARFLSDSGYTGRCTKARIEEIIDKAKAVREKKE